MSRICTRAEQQARRRLSECVSSIPQLPTPDARSDPETVHDLRVGCRRARVTLSEFGDQFAPGPRREARESFREIRKRLGKSRELDVSLRLLDDFAASHPLAVDYARARLDELRRSAEAAVADLRDTLNPATLAAQVETLDAAYRPTVECYRKHAEDRLRKRLKKLSGQYKTWKQTRRPDDLHDLRIRFKKMRYTLEVYVDLYGKHGKELLREFESAQDALGNWNDHRVLNEYVQRMLAEAEPANREALAALSSALAARIDEFLAEIEKQTDRFFEKDRVRSAKELFANPKRPCCDKG